MLRSTAQLGRPFWRVAGAAIAAASWLSCSSPTTPTPPPPVVTPAAPTISCPLSSENPSLDGRPVVVAYVAPTATGDSAPVTVACSPASGTSFPVGSTPVSCTATDAIGRTATCGFSIVVTRTPRLQATTFLSFGDSMTEGVIALNAPSFRLVSSPTSYPAMLQAALAIRYYSQQIAVINAGVAGETTAAGALRLPGVVSDNRPEVVLLMEGANDVNSDRDLAVGNIADNIATMIREAQARGALVYVATLPPQRPGGSRAYDPEVVPEVNARLVALAAETRVALVDVYAAFDGVPGDLIGPDGLHPTEAGYSKIADTFYKAIVKTLEEPSAATSAAPRRR